jgi:hypothetical protein
LSSAKEASDEVSWLLVAPLVLLPTIVRRWGQRQRLGIGSRQTITAATFLAVVIATIAPGSTLAVAATTPTPLGDTVLLVELSDNPTILSIVGVLLVDDAVAATSTFIAIGVVPTVLLMIRLRCEDSNLLSLGVFGLRPWGRRLQQIMHEEPPLLSLSAAIGDLEEPDDGVQLIVHRQLLPHLDVRDACGERGDDLLVGDPGNLVPHLTEALDVLTERLALVLAHRLKIILSSGALIRRHEVGNELTAQILP